MGKNRFSRKFKKYYLINLIDQLKNFYNLEDLEILAKNFIKELKKGSIVCLKGELGAGKTTFARFIINSFYDSKKIKKPTSIKSPSFPILLIYDLFDVEIFHYDLYRIKNNSELDQLNIEENINNSITLIEWPEIIFEKNFNYKFYLIELIIHNENQRIIKIKIINNY